MNILALIIVCSLVVAFVAFAMRVVAQGPRNTLAKAHRVIPNLQSVVPASSKRVVASDKSSADALAKSLPQKRIIKSTKPSLKKVDVVKATEEEKFRWFDVKGLKFDSWDAPPSSH